MNDALRQAMVLLDEINTAISAYDPALKELARDILVQRAFGEPVRRAAGRASSTPARAEERPASDAAAEDAAPPARRRGRPRNLDVASLLRAWHPERPGDRALLGAYLATRGVPGRPVTSQAITGVLKEADLPVQNITRAVETNLKARPPRMEQKRKRGSTRQARKEYVLTDAGAEYVRGRIAEGAR